MRKALGGMLLVLAALSGCGGGGDDLEPLYVTVTYAPKTVSLFEAVSVIPVMAGFQSYVPRCSLPPGSVLPMGLVLRSDCVIEGRAAEVTRTMTTIRVGAERVVNSIDVSVEIEVTGPILSYPNRANIGTLAIGDTVNDGPSTSNWTPAPDLTSTWSYSLFDGTLPPGLTLDPATGLVSGTTLFGGSYIAYIKGTLHTQFGSFQTYAVSYPVNVNVPTLAYAADPYSTPVTYISQPFSLAPYVIGASTPNTVISNARISPALPSGLSVNDAGVISGVATTLDSGVFFRRLEANLTYNGSSSATQGSLYLNIASPVSYDYGNGSSSAVFGVPYSLAPTITVNSPTPLLPDATRVFNPLPGGCGLPSGLSLDPATGVVSGVPMSRGVFLCYLEVLNTNNGVSWRTSTSITLLVP